MKRGDDDSMFELLSLSEVSGMLKGPDAESLREQLSEFLNYKGLRNSDLYSVLTVPLVKGNASVPLTRDVFVQRLKRLGYSGPTSMLLTLFKKIDSECACHDPRACMCLVTSLAALACLPVVRSKGGIIGFTELREWMTGRMRSTAMARSVHLMSGRSDNVSLKDLTWDPQGLRCELVNMLQRVKLTPIDMVRAWDNEDGDSEFSRKEFNVRFCPMVTSWISLRTDRRWNCQRAGHDEGSLPHIIFRSP